MSEERKEAPNPEFQIGFNADEGYREVRGVNMSTVSSGPGMQRAVLEGEFGAIRNRLLGEEVVPEQTFRSATLTYLKGAYPGMEGRQYQTILDQAVEIRNYQNLVPAMLVAAIYFRQRTPTLRNRQGLTMELLDEHAPIVLAPLIKEMENRKVRQRRTTREQDLMYLKADLLRYLRYLLPR